MASVGGPEVDTLDGPIALPPLPGLLVSDPSSPAWRWLPPWWYVGSPLQETPRDWRRGLFRACWITAASAGALDGVFRAYGSIAAVQCSSCHNAGWVLVPLVGPWIDLAQGRENGLNVLDVAVGIGQIVTAAAVIGAVALRVKYGHEITVPARREKGSGLGGPGAVLSTLWLAPRAASGQAGLSIGASF